MNRYRKLFSDTVVLGLGTFGSKLLVFLLMPLYTALLSTSEYSTAELITSTANLLIPLACVGISNGIFRFAAERESDKAAVFSSSVALLACGTGGFLLLSPLLLTVGYFRGSTWLIVLYVLLANLQSVAAQYVRAIDRTRLFAVQGILNTALTILFNLLFLIVFDLGVTGYVLSVVVGNLLTTVFLVLKAELWRVFSFSRIDRRLMGELLRFSLPMIPTTVCWLITDLSDRYMVTYFCGAAVNGVYSAAYKIPTVVNLLSGIFLQAWQFSAVAESSDEQSCSRFYSRVFAGFLSLIGIGTSALILASPLLCSLLLNSAYGEARLYMPTLLCAAAVEALVSFLASVYMVRKRSMHSFLTAMAGTLLNLLLNLLWIPTWGAMGAAAATLCGYGIVLILRLLDAPRIIRFRLCLPRLGVNLLLLLAASAAVTAQLPYATLWAAAAFCVMLAVNLPALLSALSGILNRRRGK